MCSFQALRAEGEVMHQLFFNALLSSSLFFKVAGERRFVFPWASHFRGSRRIFQTNKQRTSDSLSYSGCLFLFAISAQRTRISQMFAPRLFFSFFLSFLLRVFCFKME